MPAGDNAVLYAHLCFRLSLQRPRSALESLGLIGVQSQDRAQGAVRPGRAFSGRFDSPGFPILYAAEEVETCEAEVAHHLLKNYLRQHAALRPQIFAYSLLEIPISGWLDDLRRRSRTALQDPAPRSYPRARQYALAAFRAGMDGLLYDSARKPEGTCIARFLPSGLRLPTQGVGSRTFRWNGKKLVLQA